MSTGQVFNQQPTGNLQHVIFGAESAFEVATDLSSHKLLKFDSFSATRSREDFLANHKRTTLDMLTDAWVQGKEGAAWQFSQDLRPSGAAGTAPDIANILKAAGLAETVNGGTDVQYDPANAISTTLNIVEDLETYSQRIRGGLVTAIRIKLPEGNNPAKLEAEGIGTSVIRTGYDVTTGITAGSATTIPVTELGHFEVGGFVQIGTDTNTAVGFRITAKSAATGAGNLTIHSGLTSGEASGVTVAPYATTPTAVGDIAPIISGTTQIDSTAIKVLSGELAINNEIATDLEVVGQDRIQVYRITSREILYSMQCLLRRDDLLAMKPVGVTTLNVDVTIGDTAGKKITIDVPTWQVDIPEIEVPESGLIPVTLSGRALGSSGDDSFKITFD